MSRQDTIPRIRQERQMKFHYKRIAAGLAIALGAGMAMQAAAADIQERRVKFSYPVSKTNPVGLATDKFIELVGQKTGGKIKVTGYADAQLGNEIQAMSSAQGGIIELTVVSTAGAANNVKELGIFDLPFLFHSVEEADAVIDGPVGKELLGKFAAKNLVGLCYWDYGFRQVSNSKHPINKVEDFDGLKLRVLQNRIYIDTFKALGANPLPLPYPETYTALETKAIDGQESAYLVTKSSGYQEIQKYMTETNHVFLPAVVMASKRFWDRLSKDEQAIIQQSCDESVAYFRTTSRDLERKVVGELTAAGMTMNQIAPAEKARMAQATAAVTDKYKAELGADLVDRTLATINQARK
ncbi:TRAP transporter substrate-binding protein [Bordetella bronchiseptica]|nr:TRAP transporter substrate-binding protein [Bordetella bronchiseptica]AZW21119.1 TRAP transporter substrate-binding protein [Bordetella bronchiseptica]CCJ53861.1 Putative ABC transport system, solute-binding protein [Bordetella bronchiseptica 253]